MSELSDPGPDGPQEWRSFAGGSMINAVAGVILPETLIVGPGRAVMTTAMIEPSAPESFRNGFEDVTVIDDRETSCALHYEGASRHSYGPLWLRWLLEPAPGPGVAWIELRGQDRTATRLLPSPRPALRIGQPAPMAPGRAERELTDQVRGLIRLHLIQPEKAFEQHRADAVAQAAKLRQSGQLDPASQLPDQVTRLCAALTGPRPAHGIAADGIAADGIPVGWSAMLDGAGRVDGPGLHLGLGAALPPLDDVAVRVDGLVSQPDSWRLYLRGIPAWWKHSEDGRRRSSTVSVQAGDDRGGLYVSGFAGGHGPSFRSVQLGYDEVTIEFLPRLDPLARALTLTFQGTSDEVAVDLGLPFTPDRLTGPDRA